MSCLALNASFEPLTIVPARRAVRLVLGQQGGDSRSGGGARVSVRSTATFRSRPSSASCASCTFRVASRRQVTNTFLFARDDYCCQYCGRHRDRLKGRQFLTRDHVLPLSGGQQRVGERRVGVLACNNRKGNHTPGEAGMRLRSTPAEPNYVHLVWAVRSVTPVQAKYVRMFYGDEILKALSLSSAPSAVAG